MLLHQKKKKERKTTMLKTRSSGRLASQDLLMEVASFTCFSCGVIIMIKWEHYVV